MPPSLDDLHWPVLTPRLSIRRAVASDAAATFAFRTLPPVWEWTTSRPLSLAAWISDYPARRVDTLIVTLDGAVIGDLMLRPGDGWSQTEVASSAVLSEAEIGYTIDPAHGGHGYATEAVRILLDLAFTGLGVRRVTAPCFADNTASWRLMERVGMRREQHGVRDSLHRTRGWLDGFTYALLAEEWAAAQPAEPR